MWIGKLRRNLQNDGHVGRKTCGICIKMDSSFSLLSITQVPVRASRQLAMRMDGYLVSSAKNAAQATIYLEKSNE